MMPLHPYFAATVRPGPYARDTHTGQFRIFRQTPDQFLLAQPPCRSFAPSYKIVSSGITASSGTYTPKPSSHSLNTHPFQWAFHISCRANIRMTDTYQFSLILLIAGHPQVMSHFPRQTNFGQWVKVLFLLSGNSPIPPRQPLWAAPSSNGRSRDADASMGDFGAAFRPAAVLPAGTRSAAHPVNARRRTTESETAPDG